MKWLLPATWAHLPLPLFLNPYPIRHSLIGMSEPMRSESSQEPYHSPGL